MKNKQKEKTKPEKFKKEREYEWLIISQSYLQCALINARILKEELTEYARGEGSKMDYCIKKIYGDYPQSPEYLIFPILFNFKHGTEIYLKAIIGIKNKKFPKNHNLLSLFKKANIQNSKKKKIEEIIKKYAFGHLLLQNTECDIKNQFERYPQGSPYDGLELFSTLPNIKNGNNERIASLSIINQDKIDELISDIEFLFKNIREISIKLL